MKHITTYAIMLISSMVIPLYGGQPTRSSHMRKHSMSMTDLNKQYKVEIEHAIDITPQLHSVVGIDFAWSLVPRPYETRKYSPIQQEIADEVARRCSLDDQIQYLQSIAPLTKKHPEWLDAVPAKFLLEIKNALRNIQPALAEIEELAPSTPITTLAENDDALKYPMDEEVWESDYQLFGEQMVELSLEE